LVQQVTGELGIPVRYVSADEPTLRGMDWISQQWEAARLEATGKAGAVLVLDEIQKIPAWWETVKRLWDEDTRKKRPLKVVLLGSAPLLIAQGLTESLAGRLIERGIARAIARCRLTICLRTKDNASEECVTSRSHILSSALTLNGSAKLNCGNDVGGLVATRLAARKPIVARQSMNNGAVDVPSVLFDVVTVTRANIQSTVIADGHVSYDDVYRGLRASARPPSR
jgi:hypothetical protein